MYFYISIGGGANSITEWIAIFIYSCSQTMHQNDWFQKKLIVQNMNIYMNMLLPAVQLSSFLRTGVYS